MEAPQTEEKAKLLPFQFKGQAGEYFSIWISNIFLSIITLGIYSAWAKVRRNRYFYANTILFDSSFEYLADPVKILKGRFIVLGIFLLYYIPNEYLLKTSPLLALFCFSLLAIILIVTVPWILVKSFAFRARNTSYRNIRFRFRARYFEAMGIFVGLLLLSVLTLGLLYPYFVYRKNKFIINNSSYGQTPFVFFAPLKRFYGIYFKVAFGSILFLILFALMTGSKPETSPAFILAFPLFLFAFWIIRAYVKAAVANHVWSHVSLGNNRFVSNLRTWDIFGINFSNALAISFTFGLLIPWTKIRMMRYRLTHLKLMAGDYFDSFIAGEQEKVGALGEEIGDFYDMADFFDIDFDIGV